MHRIKPNTIIIQLMIILWNFFDLTVWSSHQMSNEIDIYPVVFFTVLGNVKPNNRFWTMHRKTNAKINSILYKTKMRYCNIHAPDSCNHSHFSNHFQHCIPLKIPWSYADIWLKWKSHRLYTLPFRCNYVLLRLYRQCNSKMTLSRV